MTVLLNTQLERVAEIAHKAGAAIMSVYDSDIVVDFKSDESPLTLADQMAHQIIVSALKQMTPELPVLSEEDVDIADRDNLGKGKYWLIDPLDGTKEFVKKNGEFTVNIALIDQGAPVLGVVYAPALGLTYVASQGGGAFKSKGTNEWEPIHCSAHRPGDVWRVVGSRSHGTPSLELALNALGDFELIPMGSSLKLCLVAEGRADIYPRLGPTSLWDTAAAQCVVEAAGGKVISLEGRVLSYSDTSKLLNPYFLVHATDDVDWLNIFH